MRREELNDRYFRWMYGLVCDTSKDRNRSYVKLLAFLHRTPFTYTIDIDGARAENGVDLRYRFGREKKYNNVMISSYLDDRPGAIMIASHLGVRPCSVLEMMVALCLKCEEHIMADSELGNRTSTWFWTMINNLGLGSMDDRVFDERYADAAIQRFLKRQYKSNGAGGLFTVKRPKHDMRTTEIWYQMCWYMSELLGY